ncbi:MAG: hypothetical protein JWP48_4351 [Actinoallomurus sp.]|jgi:hypothetical protein|nr:hypothetical protein [Actinoallomurus sp.]
MARSQYSPPDHSHSHSHRRQKQARHAARLGIAGGVTGVLGVGAIAGLILVLRAHADQTAPIPRTVAERTSASRAQAPVPGASTGVRSLSQLKTGAKLDVSTPDGFSYSLAAVKGGTSDRPLASTRTPPPHSTTLGYIDYVITNTGTEPALLDFPADLFVKRSLVPSKTRCMPQPGAPADMCTLPDHTDVVNTLGFAPPRSEDEDQYIPAGASYLVRVATDMPVSTSASQRDLGLYVWNPRFTPDRRAVEVPFP